MEFDDNDAVWRVHGRWGPTEVEDRIPLVREALRRMSLGPVSLENIPALQQDFLHWRNGYTQQCRSWRRLKQTLDRLGGCVVPSLGLYDGRPPLLSVTAVRPEVVFALPAIDESLSVRLRQDTSIECLNGERVLVCPGNAHQVVLHRPPSTWLVEALLAGKSTVAQLADTLAVDHPVVADMVAYLFGAGLVTFGD